MSYKNFLAESQSRIVEYPKDDELQSASRRLFDLIGYDKARYVYNFSWAGVPLIQLPQDVQLKQELIWEVRPSVIIETGVAWGGSLLFYASLCSALVDSGLSIKPRVIGVEVDWREHSRDLLEPHPLFRKYCRVIEGSSVDEAVVEQVQSLVKREDRVLVFLDSNHSAGHVSSELSLYSPLVTKSSYIVVEDTTIEWHDNSKNIRAWGPGNSPITAINQFLANDSGKSFLLRRDLTDKLLLTGMKDGVLQRI
jgi:cephalosporin hydroxylase